MFFSFAKDRFYLSNMKLWSDFYDVIMSADRATFNVMHK